MLQKIDNNQLHTDGQCFFYKLTHLLASTPFEQILGPVVSAFDTCSATTAWMALVGCKLLSQKYLFTETPQRSMYLSSPEKPL